eukprot:Rmarinus@m.20437
MAEKQKVALITGITGQDGSYLAEYLLELGYIVHGIKRRSSSFNQARIEHLYSDTHEKKTNLFIHYGDLLDLGMLQRILNEVQPDEIYNLAAQSHVKVSFDMPVYTCQVDGIGTLNLLEAVRTTGLIKKTRFYQASTSELYGLQDENQFEKKEGAKYVGMNEKTAFHPRSPYAVGKIMAFWAVRNYREAYGLYACNGILFNHESPRRGATFVTRKITMAVGKIKHGTQHCLFLGDLRPKRDWGHARDYVRAMHMMLQMENPEDLVISTGETHSVQEFCEKAFRHAGMPIKWVYDEAGNIKHGELESDGPGVRSQPADGSAADKVVIAIDEKYIRPAEVPFLVGDCSRARQLLGWEPKVSFDNLVREMVKYDLALAGTEKLQNEHRRQAMEGAEAAVMEVATNAPDVALPVA